jgi:hypothetical protein
MPRVNHGPLSPPRKKRNYNLRRIKKTWPYTAQEIAELFGIHKNAVLRWLREGLPADRSHRPFLIRGENLARFLGDRQNSKRRRCGPTEFFCFRCRVPREACLGMADITVEDPKRVRIKALCAVCDTPVNKVQSVGVLPKIKEMFHVQQLAGGHLIEHAGASLNSDSET